jgi:hypothetical protein
MNTQLTLPIEGLPEEISNSDTKVMVIDNYNSLPAALENVLELASTTYKWWYKHPGADKIIARKSLQIVQDHLDQLNDLD